MDDSRATHWPQADLGMLAVSPSRQRRRVGSAILSKLVAAADGLGIEQLTLDVRADQAAPIALYEAHGFTEYGRLPGFVAVHEQRYDKVFYVLDLRKRDRS